MKITWGTKLAFFALCFMIFVVSMVVVISRQDVPLVEENYYENGINYQKEIDNNASMDTTISMEIIQVQAGVKDMGVMLEVYKASPGDIHDAVMYFYRPSNPEMDQRFKTEILSGQRMNHSLNNLAAGKWKIVLSWADAGKKYKLEKDFER